MNEILECLEHGAGTCRNAVLIDELRAEIARRDEIIARLKEDGERLATRAVYWDEYSNEYECIHLECGAHSENILLEHSKTCPITLHRALIEELNQIGELK